MKTIICSFILFISFQLNAMQIVHDDRIINSLLQAVMTGEIRAVNDMIDFNDIVDDSKSSFYSFPIAASLKTLSEECINFIKKSQICKKEKKSNNIQEILKKLIMNSEIELTSQELKQLQLNRFAKFMLNSDLTDARAKLNQTNFLELSTFDERSQEIQLNRQMYKLALMSHDSDSITECSKKSLHMEPFESFFDYIERIRSTYRLFKEDEAGKNLLTAGLTETTSPGNTECSIQ